VAEIERVDENGQLVSSAKDSIRDETGGFNRPVVRGTKAPKAAKRVLSGSESMLKK
jgi:hypothetical protein